MRIFLFLLSMCVFFINIFAQDAINLIDIQRGSLDSVFDSESPEFQDESFAGDSSVINDLRRRGIEFDASYEFRGALNPGWNMRPWEFDGSEQFSWAIGVLMRASLGMTAQVSDSFRVRTIVKIDIPSEKNGEFFSLGDFFFDYNFLDRVFLRAGKYEQSWGVSPNFSFTNLLSRIALLDILPPELPQPDGESYIVKFDIPIGVGGLQLLSLTRVNIAGGDTPTRETIGYGGKYNLAFRWADFNIGVFYQDYMAARGFFSVKTSILGVDFYNEWLAVYNHHTDDSLRYAFNIGFSKNFFNNKMEINCEYFYNGEESTEFFQPETEFRRMETSPFLEEHNFAFNFLYRFSGKLNPRFFTRALYASTDRDIGVTTREQSLSITPGFRVTPFPNLDIYLAVPFALGNGYYFRSAKNVLEQHRPFSVVLYVTFHGSVRTGQK